MGLRPGLIGLVALGLLVAPLSGCGGDNGPLRIGVMLPMTGPDAAGARAPLDWARDTVNHAGGIGGRPLEFVYRDTAQQPVVEVADKLAEDDSVVAVIGPDNSSDAQQAVAKFVEARKVVVPPSATSADLFRAFRTSKPQYVWRPLESDIAQVRVMLAAARAEGATSAALVTGNREYGETFYEWFGFLAVESDLSVTATIRYEQGTQPCDEPMTRALATRPDVVLAVPDGPAEAACMARAWRASGAGSRLLFSDAAQSPALVDALGVDAEGLEGTAPAPDPTNGFAAAWQARSGAPPPPFAASSYDSVLLVAYGLAASGGRAGPHLAQAISRVTSGTDTATGWDAAGVEDALRVLHGRRFPRVTGAVGAWAFDRESGIELVASTYERWRVAGGRLTVVDTVSTADTTTAATGVSQFETPPAPGKAPSPGGTGVAPPPQTGTWALLVAASKGWENYRHQADVLAQYQRLRAGGVPEDHIVVVMADDIARNPRNPTPGVVRNAVGGPNLYAEVRADYSPTQLTAEALMRVLSGRTSPETPRVIASGPGDNVLVYLAGHGDQDGLYLGLGDTVPSASDAYSVLTPSALNETISAMASEQRFRRLLVAVEVCQGGVFGTGLTAPGALLVSAASPVEDSVSANYDPSLRAWLADQFSFQLWGAEANAATTSLDELYRRLYLDVDGSHVSAYGPAFGDPAEISLGEFVTAP